MFWTYRDPRIGVEFGVARDTNGKRASSFDAFEPRVVEGLALACTVSEFKVVCERKWALADSVVDGAFRVSGDDDGVVYRL